jgi:CRISPR-associated protein Csm5
MKKFKIKMTALTPIHIGTGESYDPTNFVIDGNYLYEFDEMKFFEKLDKAGKEKFIKAVEKSGADSLFEIHRFIKQHKNIAKQAYINKVQVTSGISKAYEEKIGKVVQIGGRNRSKKNIFNQFQIEKTIRSLNGDNRVYITGSSIKGSLLTAFGEFIYKRDKALYNKMFKSCSPSQDGNIFKDLSISDSKPIKTYSIIGYALNKERFEDDENGPKTILEVIYSNENVNSEFEFELTIKDDIKNCKEFNKKLSINNIKKACDEHYLPIFKQQFKPKTFFKGREIDDFTNEYFSDDFYNKYKDFKLKNNQFLIRVGKYSQARAVTIDGIRKIRVKVDRYRSEIFNQETTTWMFSFKEDSNSNLIPFGWVLCEIES